MSFGDKIKKLRNDFGWNQEYVAEQLKISIPALSRYESGMYEPKSLGIVNDFARLYNVTTDYLLGLDIDYTETSFLDNSVNIRSKMIPILGIVKAGYDYLAHENYIGYASIGNDIPNPREYFGLKVTGDSMQPVMYENDIIVVHQQPDVESGQVAIVLIGDEEGTVKKVIKHDGYIELVAFNSYYPPRKLYKDYKIIGRVVEARISKIFE